MNRKISVIGAGQVGTATAQQIIARRLADVVLVDVMEGLARGKALDLQQAAGLYPSDCKVIGSSDYAQTAGSDLIVITAGIPRQPGMSRSNLLAANAKIMKSVVQEIAPHSPEAILIVVSNPLDVMTYLTKELSGFTPNRVLGMGGVLDAARMQAFIAQELGVPAQDVQACVLGGHGDLMLPLPHYSTVAGVPLTELLPKEQIQRIVERTRGGGAEIVACLKSGSAFLAPAASVAEMLEAILYDKKSTLPCAAYLQGEYGLHDIYLGVPAKLGAKGVEEIIELELTPEEQKQLQASAEKVRQMVSQLEI